MLKKVRIKNFRSIKDEVIIDFSATKYSMLKDTNVSNSTLKGALFVGGNATGKTSFIFSISILLDLLFTNLQIDMPQFCLFSNDDEMLLEYTFVFGDDTIVYSLNINKNGTIGVERLYLNDDMLLDRIGLNATTRLTEAKAYDSSTIDEKTLFLKTIYFNTKFTAFPILKKWFDYMSNSVYFNAERKQAFPPVPNVVSFNTNNKVLIRDYLEKYGVEDINSFFTEYGFNQQIEYVSVQNNDPLNAVQIPGTKDIFFKRKDIDVKIPIAMESLGNKTLLEMLPGFLQVIKKGGMFIVDEFSSAFHNELEELIVKYFMKKSNSAQMFCVSHSTNLLKTTLLRPDQIYAVEFLGNNGSKVKRFSSEGPRESQNIEKMYLSGIFGGLPLINEESDDNV